jgi:hypothetical protein
MGSCAKLAKRAVETEAPVMVMVMDGVFLPRQNRIFIPSFLALFSDDVPFSDTRPASRGQGRDVACAGIHSFFLRLTQVFTLDFLIALRDEFTR